MEILNVLFLIAGAGIFAMLMRPAGIVINTGLLTKGLRSEFFEKLKAMTPLYPRLTTRIPSTASREDYKALGSVPPMVELGTGVKFGGLRTETYSIENMDYVTGMEVHRNELADDQTGQVRQRLGDMVIRAGTYKDRLLGLLMENGGTNGFNSYDGVSFFNTAHVSGKSGSQSNAITSAASSPSNPTTAEFSAAIKASVAQLMSWKDDQGQPEGGDMSGIVVLTPPSLIFTALEALSSAIIANTSNVLAGQGFSAIPYPYLTTGTRFFVAKVNSGLAPFIDQEREAVRFEAQEDGSDAEFERSVYRYKAQARGRIMYGEWKRMVRCTFQ